MTEAGYLTGLRKRLAPFIYYLKINLRFGQGVPDLFLSGSKQDLWIEAKYARTVPPTLTLTDDRYWLSVSQQEWLVNRHNEGRNVAVLVGSPQGDMLFPGVSFQTPLSRSGYMLNAIKTKDMADKLLSITGPNPARSLVCSTA